MRYLFSIFFSFITLLSVAQNGKIRGTIVDDKTGETLVGVAVLVKGTTTGTASDLDGQFTLDVAEGSYDLQISYISFQTLTVGDVQVKAGEITLLDNLRMKESTLELGEVVVSAEVIRTTEAALNTIKKQSASILDGISSEKIRLTGDNTAVEAARRVTGVSIEGGKYVYVRGLGDRYSKTTLNGMDIPGLDPDRNSLQMDIFPTNLMNNMMVSKNFTADMPADFTGGLMNVETKDFPEDKIVSVSLSTSFNPDMHLNSDFLTYTGSPTDFLGFDNGTRGLPSGADQRVIPTPISGHSQQEVVDFVRSFNPELAASRKTSLPNYSASFSLGNQISLNGDKKLGYIFSVSYKSEYTWYDNIVYGEYQRYIDPDLYEMRYATLQNGEMGEQNVLVGLLGGVAIKTTFSKLRLTAMRLQNGESRAGKFEIDNDGQAVGQSGYFATSDNLEYNQRSLSNVLLNGVHVFKNSGWEIDWRLSPTFSTSDDPDIRKTAFTHSSNGSSFNAGAGGNPTRIWRSLGELNAIAKLDVTKKYTLNDREAKLKFGVSHTYKYRDYEILLFDIQFFGGQSWPDPDPSTVLNPENIYPNRPNSIYYQSGNIYPNPNAYRSNVNNTGIYISNEFELFPKLKTIVGLRAENYVQKHTGRDQRYASGDTKNGQNLDNEKVLGSFDLFPSVNLVFSLTDDQNLRASYARTIARPSFKELSFAQIIDPVSNRIFNGSFFTYPGWDGNLTETRIDNFDVRWELFMKSGQILSMSAFYKKFDNPIELVRIPEQQTSTEYQPRNVGNGRLYGVELEFRKDLDFISPAWSHFNLNGNFTFVESLIDMTEIEFKSRKSYEKTGETIKDTRQMAGQAPYVINGGVSYNHYESGFDAGLFYNVKGPTLSIVGAGLFPDIFIKPFHSLNFSLNKKIGESKNTTIDFKVSNILNARTESYYQSYHAENKPYSQMSPGRKFSLGVSYRF
ncbi:TonB-dependent receptor [Mariniphaga sediminis]|jgi:TonB-dependent receptor|uniref:TonB-dependent receptor n=1 Tax=Mariniphaga sediminis TaxID=1628158 RepID=A0A399CZP0_9BACT|nr:TonB-dependent receptor [Mariniphaga sediminis]RIH64623.1 TonB-dependent receptor [Mariniphaga sediminis]